MADLWATDLLTSGVAGRLLLPPDVLDARAFQWRGMRAEVRYTLIADFESDPPLADAAVRKRIGKACRAGYRAELCEDPAEILSCLAATEQRQNFAHLIDLSALSTLWETMPRGTIRGHCVRSPTGEAVSAGVRLVSPDGWAIDWLQGSKREHLDQGVNQLAYEYALQDMQGCGAKLFDFGGANIRNVARAKEKWGFPLKPYIAIAPASFRNIAREGLRLGATKLQHYHRTRRAAFRAK